MGDLTTQVGFFLFIFKDLRLKSSNQTKVKFFEYLYYQGINSRFYRRDKEGGLMRLPYISVCQIMTKKQGSEAG